MQQPNQEMTSQYDMICKAISIGLGLDIHRIESDMVHFIGTPPEARELYSKYEASGVKVCLMPREDGLEEVVMSAIALEIAIAFR